MFSLFTFLAVGCSVLAEFTKSPVKILWIVRFALFFASFIPLMFYRFTFAFSYRKPRFKWFYYGVYVITPVLAVVSLLPQTMSKARLLPNGGYTTNIGPLLWLTVIVFLIIFSACFVILIEYGKRSDNRIKLQVRLMIYGVGAALLMNLGGQIALPELHVTNVEALRALVAAPSDLVFVLAVSYAMLRHKMFDVRSAVLRSIGYLLTIVTIVGVYIFTLLGISRFVFPNLNLSGFQNIYFVLAAILLAVSFSPLAKVIRIVTNKLFKQINYDPQQIINDVGQVLATEIKIGILSKQVNYILDKHMQTQTDIIVLEHGQIFFESGNYFTKQLPSFVHDLETLGFSTLFFEDPIDENQKHIMHKYGIAVFSVLKTHNEKIGYLLFSDKTNGNTYSKKDISLIDTIADEIAIGFQNSRSFSVLQEFNKTLQKKVDYATKEYRVANQKLKDDDLVKDDFISMASHQLSTPLSVIDGYLTLAKQGIYGNLNDKLGQSLGSALDRAEVMKNLLVDLLDISRMTAGKFSLQITPSNINKVVETEVDQLQAMAVEKKVELEFHPPEKPLPTLNIDAQKTGQVVMNLVHNALNYASGGKVDVYLQQKDNLAVVRVIDNGIGVPEDQKAKLFSKFYRADNAKKERPNGTGIGLYLVKRVIDDQGGKIIFSSELNKGSTFGFSIPIYGLSTPPKSEVN
jgi:signal transduction histidine kinase